MGLMLRQFDVPRNFDMGKLSNDRYCLLSQFHTLATIYKFCQLRRSTLAIAGFKIRVGRLKLCSCPTVSLAVLEHTGSIEHISRPVEYEAKCPGRFFLPALTQIKAVSEEGPPTVHCRQLLLYRR